MKLVKSIATGVLMLAAVTVSNAQNKGDNSTSRAASFGVKGGVNFATITGKDFDSPDARTSFHVGVVGEMPISDMFSIQAEALYSGQGYKSAVPGMVSGEKAEYQLDYINVPVLAKIYIAKGFSIEAGPQVSFKVNEEFDFNPNGDSGDVKRDQAEDLEFGVAGGITFQTSMGLFATGRYIYGVTDIIKDVDAQNSVFQIGVGFKF